MNESTKKMAGHPAKMLNIGDVGALLSVSERSVRRYVQQRSFPRPIRLNGRSLRWLERDVIAWVTSQLEK